VPSKRNTATNDFNDGIALWARPLLWAGGTLLSRPRDSALAIAAGVAAGAILINSLYLQPGPHPAPIFAIKHSPIAADVPTGAVANTMPRARPADAASVEPASQPRAVAAPAPVPLVPPAATTVRRDKDPIAELLGSSPGRASAASGRVASIAPSPVLPAPIPAAAPAISGNQLAAIQRRLAEFGYGPVASTGNDGPDTRAAIERFERRRGMPVTGKVSERLTRELTAVTGPL
jgi:hypothetical protein